MNRRRKPEIKFSILTIFPSMFHGLLNESILKRAVKGGYVEFNLVDIRDFTEDKHRTVDDRPYGGGAGMVMMYPVLYKAWRSIVPRKSSSVRTILMSPGGTCWDSEKAASLNSKYRHVVLVCGRYEGLDQRFIDECVDEEISIGDYILSGGELAAAVIIDSVTRLVPGVLGNAESSMDESFRKINGVGSLLEYPHYTRPREFRGKKVPEVLLEGNHAKIEQWRRKRSISKTKRNRPDLLDQ